MKCSELNKWREWWITVWRKEREREGNPITIAIIYINVTRLGKHQLNTYQLQTKVINLKTVYF